jgi:uncharacterized membrane protein
MIIQPIDYFLVVWFALAALSTVYVAWDQFRNNPEPVVMKWGFVLVTLYMGPLGLLMYVLADKEPRPGEHEEFIKPLWKQGVGSTIHCVAGDATGIILAAAVTATLGLPMWIDLIVEYAAGFAFGLFIFQSLFMKDMMGGSYWENVRKTFLPELISMNLMMGAMAPVMSFLMMGRDMRAMDPAELLFWGVMSLGVIAGFALALPVNAWMVARKLKHGLMTERVPGSRFDLMRGRRPVAAKAHAAHAADGDSAATTSAHGHEHAAPAGHAAMAHGKAGGKPMKPIHPILVHFPIALLVLSAGSDFLALVGGTDSLRDAGWWALLGAAVGGVFTVLAGLFDMQRASLTEATHERVHRHMKVGFALATVIAVLAVWRGMIHFEQGATLGWTYMGVALLAVGLAALQGWLGGELVYTYGVGVRSRYAAPAAGHAEHGGHAAQAEKSSAKPAAMDHAAMAKGKAGARQGHAQEGEGGDEGMSSDVTRPQLVAVAGVTLIALLIGMVAPANWVNLRLSVRDVGGRIMPPGMIMDRDTPAQAMRDMSAVLPRYYTAQYGLEARGDRELAPRLEAGVKVFELETSVIRWRILPGIDVGAFAYNGQVPGPRLRIRQGDRVRINVTNRLPESTTVHWHGLILPNVMDGPAEVTQKPIQPGEVYRYEFTAVQSGTYFYHSHDHVDRQQALGLYGALIIDPANPADEVRADQEYTIQLQEWLMREGLTYPAMPMDRGQPNYFTINGRAYPETDVIRMKVGETLKIRFIGSNTGFIHPMHVHGGPFTVVARDGETLSVSARYKADTVNVGPGQRYDVVWTALKPGKWMIHCHISHHTTNNNVETKGGGGLMMHIEVEGDPTK